jgi:hypothetical protein
MYFTPKAREKAETAILSHLNEIYADDHGGRHQGQSLSFLLKWASDDANLHDQRARFVRLREEDITDLGFTILDGKNSRGQRCRFVTL